MDRQEERRKSTHCEAASAGLASSGLPSAWAFSLASRSRAPIVWLKMSTMADIRSFVRTTGIAATPSGLSGFWSPISDDARDGLGCSTEKRNDGKTTRRDECKRVRPACAHEKEPLGAARVRARARAARLSRVAGRGCAPRGSGGPPPRHLARTPNATPSTLDAIERPREAIDLAMQAVPSLQQQRCREEKTVQSALRDA